DYRRAAANAIKAGFDGVEIHGANGYLIDQFLRTTSNQRTDDYGGSQQNRLRFLQEVVTAVAAEVGADRTGIRLAPFITAHGMACPEILDTILAAADFLTQQQLAYVHLAEADWDDAPTVTEDFRQALRRSFNGRIIVAGKFDKQRAEKILAEGYTDMIAFGRFFVANPDLVARLQYDFPLTDFNGELLFGGDGRGYTDYPVHAA
ncbi:MAG TPA: alkene reductase, partial [Cellvibrio sp.]|nr:alkene reductase [Cellvibrio sp.]